jgi:hypothetical protein
MHKFKELDVYKKALTFTRVVRETTKRFPKDELFVLSAQFRRAADSIVLNIAEGAGGIPVRKNLPASLTTQYDPVLNAWVALTSRWKTSSSKNVCTRHSLTMLMRLLQCFTV